MPRPISSIVIIGGGTAGWMAAAALSSARKLEGVKITLVESSDIGTIGVGEATLPTLRQFHAVLKIDEAEFMKATRATFKLGIRFNDWNRLGGSFFHPFSYYGATLGQGAFHEYWARGREGGFADPLESYCFSACMAEHRRFAQPHPKPPAEFANYTYAFHFDAGLYARFLKSYATARGVTAVDDLVTDVARDAETGHIESVNLRSGQALSADMFIDCSGFRALLLEGALKTGFEDWSHWLPVDRAVALPCERGPDLTPFTTATAMEAGWRWRIPLTHRTGNGHVYCSAWLDDEAALSGLTRHLDGRVLGDPNFIRFTTGRRKAFWAGNCIGLGLSTGFIEPLESTSIGLIQSGLTRLLAHWPDTGFDATTIAAANAEFNAEMERIRDFIILHYKATSRDDSALWRYVRDMAIPDSLRHQIEAFTERGEIVRYPHDPFEAPSWLAMYAGFGLTPRQLPRRAYDLSDVDLNGLLSDMKGVIAQNSTRMLSHAAFIDKYLT